MDPRRFISRGLLLLALTVLAACGVATPRPAHAQAAVSVDFFYDQLAPYGQWVQSPEYGWVWYPTSAPPGWQPYSDGRWVWTDDGWYFDSGERWAWATFHYGRWYYDAGHGWAWVPGTVWSPAWVAWRSGGGYIGWAPLPPRVGWHAGFGFRFGGEISLAIGEPYWTFVERRSFCAPRVHDVILVRAHNHDLFGRTRDRTRYEVAGHRAVNRSIPVDRFEHAAHVRAPRARFVDASSPHAPRAFEHGRLAVYRPDVRAAAPEPRPPRRLAPASVHASRMRAPQAPAWSQALGDRRAARAPATSHASSDRRAAEAHRSQRPAWSRSAFTLGQPAARRPQQSAWSRALPSPRPTRVRAPAPRHHDAPARLARPNSFSSRAAQPHATFRSAPRLSAYARASAHAHHETRARRR